MDSQEPLTNQKDLEAANCYGSFPHMDHRFLPSFAAAAEDASVEDSMTYSLPWLRTWSPLFTVSGTVWHSREFWKIMLQLWTVAIVVGLAAYNLLPDPEQLDSSKFGDIVAILTLFVSLMLSFFLSMSVNRWLKCLDGFEEVLQSIRMMALQFHALGANRERADSCLRYATMSAHFLAYELAIHKLKSESDKVMVLNQFWDTYLAKPAGLAGRPYSVLHLDEKNRLDECVKKCKVEKSGCMWLWVSSLIGRMAEDGEIPAMATPTYGRIMQLANDAQTGLRAIQTAVVVQMPFIYLHLLSVLVHVTCILQSINLGLAIGVSWHAIRRYVNHYYVAGGAHPADAQIVPLTTQFQTLFVDGLKGILGPMLYQAFFDMGVTLSSPFSYPGAGVPAERLIRNVERELEAYNELSGKPPFWEPPKFHK